MKKIVIGLIFLLNASAFADCSYFVSDHWDLDWKLESMLLAQGWTRSVSVDSARINIVVKFDMRETPNRFNRSSVLMRTRAEIIGLTENPIQLKASAVGLRFPWGSPGCYNGAIPKTNRRVFQRLSEKITKLMGTCSE